MARSSLMFFDDHLSSFIPPHYPHSFLNVQRCSKHSNRIPNMPWVMRHALRLWRIPSRECQALQYARWVGASSSRTSLQSEWIRQIWRNSGGQDIASELTWINMINLHQSTVNPTNHSDTKLESNTRQIRRAPLQVWRNPIQTWSGRCMSVAVKVSLNAHRKGGKSHGGIGRVLMSKQLCFSSSN